MPRIGEGGGDYFRQEILDDPRQTQIICVLDSVPLDDSQAKRFERTVGLSQADPTGARNCGLTDLLLRRLTSCQDQVGDTQRQVPGICTGPVAGDNHSDPVIGHQQDVAAETRIAPTVPNGPVTLKFT